MRFVAAALSLVAAVLLCPPSSYSQANSPNSAEYKFKAVYLFNFLKFIEWPHSAFAHVRSPFVIGIFGDNPFGGSLAEAVSGEQIGGRGVVVRRFNQLDSAKDCHVLFVSASEESRMGPIVAALRSKPVVLVSDIEEFAANGGTIEFYIQNKKLRFAINESAAARSGVKLSSRLLKLARIVEP